MTNWRVGPISPKEIAMHLRRISPLLLALVIPALPAFAGGKAVEARNGMVVSVSAPATEVGVAVLKKGGNAVDAAVATAFALAVTYPQAGNIGGGGFMLIHPVKGEPTCVEYRESAPAAATRDMFGKHKGALGHLVVGTPGTVRGLALAHQKYGKLPWKDVVMPAIDLANDGFVLEKLMADQLNALVGSSPGFPELASVFGKNGGKDSWKPGDRLVQPDLARTLRLIAENGPDAFYRGPIAEQLEAEMKSHGGLITKADLEHYAAHERKPIHGTYRGYDVYGPPPPSSGGTAVVEALNILENFDLKPKGRYAPETVHLMAEAMRRTFADRARYLGDPDFTKIPEKLTTKEYARDLAKGIVVGKATPSVELAQDIPLAGESDSTTHFSVVDKDGMAVSNTYTLEHSFGSRVVVRGAGFLLNNEMGDFNWHPGHTDRKGDIGTEPNTIAPGKRMLSSQTPTIVAKDGKVLLVTGSPGSRTIINTVLCVVINVIDFGMDIQAAVDAPRMHHQWFPDQIDMERLKEHIDLARALEKMGHKSRNQRQGDAHSIWVDPKTGSFHGAADTRIMGKALGY
jgi:gamma-glutamyltranspeptidase/glutathione hydrolase